MNVFLRRARGRPLTFLFQFGLIDSEGFLALKYLAQSIPNCFEHNEENAYRKKLFESIVEAALVSCSNTGPSSPQSSEEDNIDSKNSGKPEALKCFSD